MGTPSPNSAGAFRGRPSINPNTDDPMTKRLSLAGWCLLSPVLAWAQQANVNLDYDPQKNTENLIPFSARLNSPDVRDDRTVTFRLQAPAAKEVRLAGAVLTALGKEAQPARFKQGADGIWTLTVGPLRPNMYASLDNLLAEQKAAPMVIAIPNNQVVHRNHPQHTELTFNLLYHRFLPNLWRKN